jgi:glycogen synthase
MLKVLFVASEAAPFIKTGGLADVAGALPRALLAKGIDARVIILNTAPSKQVSSTRCRPSGPAP